MRDDQKADYYSSFEQDHRTFGFSNNETSKKSRDPRNAFLFATFAVLAVAASLLMIGSSST